MSQIKTKIAALPVTIKVMDYAQLFKFRLTSYVVLSAVLGYFIGVQTINYTTLFWLILGGLLITASSNALNQVLEKDTDKLMKRTQSRPLPDEKMSVVHASIISLLMGIVGVFILWFGINPLSGILGALAIVTYAGIYTPLKRITTYSVFVGAFPGAIPP